MEYKANLCCFLVALSFLSSFDCEEISKDSEEVKGVLKAYIKKSRKRLDIKMADLATTMKEEFGGKLDHIMKSVGYLERREKMAELCPPGSCGTNRVCELSDDLEKSDCPCVDGLGGKNCEIRGPCFIEQYRYSEIPSGPEFPYNCSDDGYYSALQLNETGEYCVTDNNEVILGYRRDDAEGITSGACKCARSKYRDQWLGRPENKYSCKPNGDFHETACDEEICWCQNEFGGISHGFRIYQIDEFRPICESKYYIN